jgi:hypothetical protein
VLLAIDENIDLRFRQMHNDLGWQM